MKLAIFDFDGTISDRDSFLDFIIYCHGYPKTMWGILIHLPVILMILRGGTYRGQAKEKVFTHFFGQWPEGKFDRLAREYINQHFSKIIRPKALDRLYWHKKEGHKIVIVSASFENYLKVWCDHEGLELIATRLEIKDGKITGRFLGENCYGEEKVSRIKSVYNLKDFEFIYAYGDSKGDLALKNIANEFHYKPFRS